MKNFAFIVFLRFLSVAIALVLFGLAYGDLLQPADITSPHRPTISYLLPMMWVTLFCLAVIATITSVQDHWPVSVVSSCLFFLLFGVAWYNEACNWYAVVNEKNTIIYWGVYFEEKLWWGIVALGFTKDQFFWTGIVFLVLAMALLAYEKTAPDEDSADQNPAFQTHETSDGED